jgi:hypothetical protein
MQGKPLLEGKTRSTRRATRASWARATGILLFQQTDRSGVCASAFTARQAVSANISSVNAKKWKKGEYMKCVM